MSRSIFPLPYLLGLMSLGLPLTATLGSEQTKASHLTPCSERYPLVASLQANDWIQSGKQAIRSDFASTRDWGTEENLLLLNPLDSGLAEPALRVLYPKNSSSPSDADEEGVPRGGLGFYTAEKAFAGSDRACLRYRVRFEEGFDFVKGGKLPGLYGGEAPSGGEEATGENGFSLRLMWREQGQGELYPYLVDLEGESIGRGTWHFPSGRWIEVEQEVILNAPDKNNGVARIWIDSWPVLERRDLTYRTTDKVGIDGLMFSTFFGGTGEEWRTPHDQHADFATFHLFTF